MNIFVRDPYFDFLSIEKYNYNVWFDDIFYQSLVDSKKLNDLPGFEAFDASKRPTINKIANYQENIVIAVLLFNLLIINIQIYYLLQ